MTIMRGRREDVVSILEGDDTQKEARTPGGKTPAMIAVEHERHDILDYLIKRKVDLSKKESASSNTALHIAALKGDAKSAEMIFRAAPETAVSINYVGETPFHLAVKSQALEVLKVMK